MFYRYRSSICMARHDITVFLFRPFSGAVCQPHRATLSTWQVKAALNQGVPLRFLGPKDNGMLQGFMQVPNVTFKVAGWWTVEIFVRGSTNFQQISSQWKSLDFWWFLLIASNWFNSRLLEDILPYRPCSCMFQLEWCNFWRFNSCC